MRCPEATRSSSTSWRARWSPRAERRTRPRSSRRWPRRRSPGRARPAVRAELGEAQRGAGDVVGAVAALREALDGPLDPGRRTAAVLALAQAISVAEGSPAAVAVLEAGVGRTTADLALRLDVER